MNRRGFVRLTTAATAATLASFVLGGTDFVNALNMMHQITNTSIQPQRRYIPQTYVANFPTAPTRLLAKVGDFGHVWELIQTNAKARSLYEQLKKDAEAILQQPSGINDPTLLNVRAMLDRIYTLGLIYRLEGDRRYSDRAWGELESATHLTDWNPQSFLNTAEMTHALALGYDWFPWAEKQRATLRDAMVAKGLMPALQCYRGQADFGWWVRSPSNWNQVCNGGVGMGALALSPELPDLCQQILDYAVQSLQLSMKDFAPDGGWAEGPGYWDYATFYSSVFLAALETTIGTDLGLAAMPGFSDTGLFPIYVTGPPVNPGGAARTFNFADSCEMGLQAYQMLWLARRFQRPVYSWYPQTLTAGLDMRFAHFRSPALSLLWFDSGERDPKSEGLPLDKYFGGRVQVATFRTAWNDKNALFVGLKAGDNKANHSHLDVGTFVLDALGERWVDDIGSDNYSLPGYFDAQGQRWNYYRTRAEGHNTLVLNPSQGPDQDLNAAAKITRFLSEPAKAFAIADLTPAYREPSNGSLEKLERGVALLNRTTIVVQDEVTEKQPFELWWFMHTKASVRLGENGSTAMLERGPSAPRPRLWCAIASPSDARFSLMDAKPLPSSPNPPGQADNSPVRKLAVHLSGVTSTRLTVVMAPLSVGQEPPGQVLSVIPLEEW